MGNDRNDRHPRRQENHDPDLVSAVNTPYLDQFIPADHLKKGEKLKTPDGQSAVVVGGSVPVVHDGWMWDLTVQDDHDFYVEPAVVLPPSRAGPATVAILVHNCGEGGGASDLVHVYRAAQKGNGESELASGLNPAHRLAYVGTEDVAQKYADYSVGTHEDFYTKFTFNRSDFDENFGPGFLRLIQDTDIDP